MNKKFFAGTALALSALLIFGGCSASGDFDESPGNNGSDSAEGVLPPASDSDGSGGNYSYGAIVEQGFKDTQEEPASYFSLDRNTANYAQVRSQIRGRRKIASDSVRIEELVNYFTYEGYTMPEDGAEISITPAILPCPWNGEHLLLSAGIRTEARVLEGVKNNYTFLIDVSGSMEWNIDYSDTETTRLDLIKHGIETLLTGLGEQDFVSVVTYANGVKTVLEPTAATGSGKTEIMRAVSNLKSGGSTNGSGGLQRAYELAGENFSEDGNNRVILMTDGDFNVGMSSADELESFIRGKAENGVYLSVIGVGLGNMRDDIMETLALAGNGNYAYIDSALEAEKVLSRELSGTLVTVAKDVKAGITFNPETVESYRIIGYDMKMMSEEDFNDPSKDAGEIGSNLCVTVLYEMVPKTEEDGTMSEEGTSGTGEEGDEGGTVGYAELEIRYRRAEDGKAASVKVAIDRGCTSSDDALFAACVAEFGLILRQSEYRAGASFAGILARLEALGAYVQRDPLKAEFCELVGLAEESGFYPEKE